MGILGEYSIGALLEECLLEFMQLSHKVKVGRYDGTLRFDEFVSVNEVPCPVAHQVGDGNGGTSADARLTVHQYALTS